MVALPASTIAAAHEMGPAGPATIRRWAQESPELRVGVAPWDRGIRLYDADAIRDRVTAWRAWHRRDAAREATR